MKTVVVGMSGGVDSSVSALLLKRAGYLVIGLFMKNWEEQDEGGTCLAAKDYDDVARVCEAIDIPYYAVNFSKEYENQVFSHFLEGLKKGFTPNPDILCNREIKFHTLLDKALELGADYLATGHYVQKVEREGRLFLGRGADGNKDQSYFLYTLKEKTLEKLLFPVGSLLKSEVRRLAKEASLATAEKKDSTGICFIGKRNFREFLSRYIAYQEGNFETPEGRVVGRHKGVAYYTLGQRRGLGIGGPGEAWFVVDKDVEQNKVIVVQGEDHPLLYKIGLVAGELEFVHEGPLQFPVHCTAKIRYRQKDAACTIHFKEEGRVSVTFQEPQRAVTAHQSIVFYQGDVCLGGGLILESV